MSSSGVSLARGLTVEHAVEPVIAWRAWALTGHRDGTGLLLRPVAGRSRPWKPLEASEAACKAARFHAAPNIDCTCGLHGAHSPEILRKAKTPAVLGRVALWGRVIEHEHGYRAQFAYPQRLRLVCQFCFWHWGMVSFSPEVVGWFPHGELLRAQLQVSADHALASAAVKQADPDVGRAEETSGDATELLGVGQCAAQRIGALQQRGVELTVEAGAHREVARERHQRHRGSDAHCGQPGDSGPQRHPPIPKGRVGRLCHGGVTRNA